MPYINNQDLARLKTLADKLWNNEKARAQNDRRAKFFQKQAAEARAKNMKLQSYIAKIEQLQEDALSILARYDNGVESEQDEFLPEELWLTLKEMAFSYKCQIWFSLDNSIIVSVDSMHIARGRPKSVCWIEDIALSANGLQGILNYCHNSRFPVAVEAIHNSGYRLVIDLTSSKPMNYELIQMELVRVLPSVFVKFSKEFKDKYPIEYFK